MSAAWETVEVDLGEFAGQTIEDLPMNDRFTICNMAIEAGGKNGIIGFDDTTKAYLDGRLKGKTDYTVFESDADAEYVHEDTIDCSKLEPMVAFPHLPSNGKPISEAAGFKMDQCYIGSCTNGRIDVLEAAADIIRGKKVAQGTRMLVFPASGRKEVSSS